MKIKIIFRKAIALFIICLYLIKCTEPQQKKHATYFENEKAAIRKVIEKETESYYKQDFESWKSTYLQSPAFRKYGYWEGYSEKVVCYNGFDSLASEKKTTVRI